jgi:hypothetical protein
VGLLQNALTDFSLRHVEAQVLAGQSLELNASQMLSKLLRVSVERVVISAIRRFLDPNGRLTAEMTRFCSGPARLGSATRHDASVAIPGSHPGTRVIQACYFA